MKNSMADLVTRHVAPLSSAFMNYVNELLGKKRRGLARGTPRVIGRPEVGDQSAFGSSPPHCCAV